MSILTGIPSQRRVRAWRTKRRAAYELLDRLRAYARAKRASDLAPFNTHMGFHDTDAHGQFLGALGALYACGVIGQAQYERAMARCRRITSATVTRKVRL